MLGGFGNSCLLQELMARRLYAKLQQAKIRRTQPFFCGVAGEFRALMQFTVTPGSLSCPCLFCLHLPEPVFLPLLRGGALLTSPSGPGYHIMLPFITTFKSVQVGALSLPWGPSTCPLGKLSPLCVCVTLLGVAVSCSARTAHVCGCHCSPAAPHSGAGKRAQLPVRPPKGWGGEALPSAHPCRHHKGGRGQAFDSVLPLWESGPSWESGL